jgi:hypothetical protein
MAQRKLTQPEKAEIASEERKREPYKPRDFQADFAAPAPETFENPGRLPDWAGWGGEGNNRMPPPALPGTHADGSPWVNEKRVYPDHTTEEMIGAVMFGGGYFGSWPNMTRVSLLEGDEQAPSAWRKRDGSFGHGTKREWCRAWFPEPLYDPMDFRTMPWGQKNDYRAARTEAVRLLEASRLAQRGGLDDGSHCQGCGREVGQVMFSTEHVKWLCRDCAPDLAWIGSFEGK